MQSPSNLLAKTLMGLTINCTNEFVQSHFLDGVLILRYINKMGTNGEGGVVDGRARRFQAQILDRG